MASFNEKAHIFLTGTIAFLIPSYPNALPLAIAFLTLNWLFAPKLILPGIKKNCSNPIILSLITFYLLYILGMAYTSNTSVGLETLETKFSFLILPFVFSSYVQLTKNNFNKYLKYFILGCTVNALICLGWATYCFLKHVLVELYCVYYDLGAGYFYYNQL